MKTYFFINPAAGQGKGTEQLAEEIRKAASDLQTECEIYFTEGVYDGQKRARRIAEELNGEAARFYACGGDGTLNEIINGAYGFENIETGCIPIGTGNDTVRYFSEAGDFRSVRAQLSGKSVPVDLIRYTGMIEGRKQTRYCINMFNVGFDCNVVELAGRLKKKPLISGSFAYLLAILGMFIKKEGIRLKLMFNVGFDCNVVELAGRLKKKPLISGSFAYLLAILGMFIKKEGIRLKLTEDEEVLADGEVLLCAVAGGNYCGGGLKTSPQSDLTDGFFDVNIIKNIKRRQFLRLFPIYVKGKHLGMTGLDHIITMKKCTHLKLTPASESFYLCADGEIRTAGEVEFEIVPAAVRFILPQR